MSGIRKIVQDNKEIFIVDYSDSKEDRMIEILVESRKLIEKENKPVLILSIFNDKSYVTPNFMRHLEKEPGKSFVYLISRL